MCLTIGGADEGETGDDPEEGHGGGNDDDEDVLKESCCFIPEPCRASANQSGWLFDQLSCQLLIRREAMAAFPRVSRLDLQLSDWLSHHVTCSQHVFTHSELSLTPNRSQICQDDARFIISLSGNIKTLK